MPKILICDDDQLYQLSLRQLFKNKYEVLSAYNSDEALAILRNRPIDIILLDVQMRTPREGLDAISKIRAIDEEISIVMLSGLKDFETVRESLRLGATDYIAKDATPDEFDLSMNRVLQHRKLLKTTLQQNFECSESHKKNVLVGNSQSMVSLRRLIDKIRDSNTNVVITGETGTGKEVVARLLRSTGRDGSFAPFISVDSATIHSNTAESILFGHEKGAFTGADKMKKGIFEEANGGIIYFDEIANMTLEIQAKLLRVIQEKEVTRLGGAKAMPLEFRVVAATNRNLDEMVKLRLFKDDLLQRLNVIPLNIPPLRERKEDIPALVEHFVIQQSSGKKTIYFTEDAISALQNYDWPGNVRELNNVVSYLFAVTEGEEIDVCDLPPKFRAEPTGSTAAPGTDNGATLYDKVSEFEKKIITEAYSKAQGNISRLALTLGMDRSHLYTKLRLYGLHSKKTAE